MQTDTVARGEFVCTSVTYVPPFSLCSLIFRLGKSQSRFHCNSLLVRAIAPARHSLYLLVRCKQLSGESPSCWLLSEQVH